MNMFASVAAHFQVDDRFSGREFECVDIPEMCCFHMTWFNVAGVEDEERTAPALELAFTTCASV